VWKVEKLKRGQKEDRNQQQLNKFGDRLSFYQEE
jgi:hypothetical protein